MAETSYYVYALKDPRSSPAKPFYIGKGVGVRSHDHLLRPDNSRKGERIRDINKAGQKVLVTRLIEDLTEEQALKLEAELISAYGTEDFGGQLTNSVVPKGESSRPPRDLVIPLGAKEKAQLGLTLIKNAVLELAKVNQRGVTNSDVASGLGLRSDYGGGSKDYLSYSLLGLLMRDGLLQRESGSKRHIPTVR